MERVARAVSLKLAAQGVSAYTVTNWATGWSPPRNAVNLNKLEQAAAANQIGIDSLSGGLTPTIYVATTGNDSTGNGTSGNPYATLSKGMTVAVSGDVIGMAAGTYTLNSTITVKNGVSIVGAGSASTILQGSGDPLLLVSGTTVAQTISSLALNGQNKGAGTRGLNITNAQNLTVDSVNIHDFAGVTDGGGCINVSGGTQNLVVSNSTLTNGGRRVPSLPDPPYATGTLGVGAQSNCVYHDLTISESVGFCTKVSGVNPAVTNVEFYNITCHSTGVAQQTGPDGSSPIGAELYNVAATNVRIHHCNFNSTLSLSPAGTGPLPAGQWRYQIYNNFFDIPPENLPSIGMGYSIEAQVDSVEVHHNYFRGGFAPFCHFNESTTRSFQSFHHNVLDNQEGGYAAICRYDLAAITASYTKNTFVGRIGFNSLFITPTSSTPTITDNIFTAVSAMGDHWGANMNTGSTNHNVFFNYTSKGTNAIVPGSQPLPLSGSFPTPYIPAASPANTCGAFVDGVWSDIGPQ